MFYLLTQKIYLRSHWLYAFQILFSWGILRLMSELVHSHFSNGEILACTISLVLCSLSNMWILIGLTVRRCKTAICSTFKLPIQDYSAPFFRWSTIIVTSAFFVIGILQLVFLFNHNVPISPNSKTVILISQALISLALFFHLYRSFLMLHTILLYISGWLVFVSVSAIFKLSGGWLILITAVYAVLWHLVLRCRNQVRNLLQKIQLTFPETENITTIVEGLLYCNTVFVLLITLLEVSSESASYQSIVAICLISCIYLVNAFDRKEESWSYLGMAVFTLGSYA